MNPTEPQPTEPVTPSVDSFKLIMDQFTLNIGIDEESYNMLCEALSIYNSLSDKDKEWKSFKESQIKY